MKLLKNKHFVLFWGLAWTVFGACGGAETGDSATHPGVPPSAPEMADSAAPVSWEPFVDRTEEVGLDFVHFNGMTGRFYIVEVTASGCGMADIDGDGDLDLYLPQGRLLEPGAGPEEGAHAGRSRTGCTATT